MKLNTNIPNRQTALRFGWKCRMRTRIWQTTAINSEQEAHFPEAACDKPVPVPA